MIVEELRFHRKTKQKKQKHWTPCYRARMVVQTSSELAFVEEPQLHLRMSTLVPILSFDNQRIGEEKKKDTNVCQYLDDDKKL